MVVQCSINANINAPLSRSAGGTQRTDGDFNSMLVTNFTSNGTFTPNSGCLWCTIECVSGGGGGGGAGGGASGASAGGGGGSGAYARKSVSATTIGASQSVVVGAAGSGGANTGGNGGAGGTSSVGSIVSCTGGSGGIGMVSTGNGFNSTAGGAGGTASGGDMNVNGGAGANGLAQFQGLALLSLNIQASLGGQGADSYFGAGGRGVVGAGQAANGSGAGGGGGSQNGSATGQAGGAGSAGKIVITEFIR